MGSLCHAVAFGKKIITSRPLPPRGGVIKKGSVMDRESSVALCHGVALKKKKMIGRRPRERCVSFPLFGRKNELQGRKEHNAKGDRERAESRSLCCFT